MKDSSPSVRVAAVGLGWVTRHRHLPALRKTRGIELAGLVDRRPGQAEVIARQLNRLLAPDQMGELFKVCCIHSTGLEPPAFEEPA